MSLTMTPILIHSEHVPRAARDALRAADRAPPEDRLQMLESAAQILYDETDLECGDVRELIGLSEAGGCG